MPKSPLFLSLLSSGESYWAFTIHTIAGNAPKVFISQLRILQILQTQPALTTIDAIQCAPGHSSFREFAMGPFIIVSTVTRLQRCVLKVGLARPPVHTKLLSLGIALCNGSDLTVLPDIGSSLWAHRSLAVAVELVVGEYILQARDALTTVVAGVHVIIARLIGACTTETGPSGRAGTVLAVAAEFLMKVKGLASRSRRMIGEIRVAGSARGVVEALKWACELRNRRPHSSDRQDQCNKFHSVVQQYGILSQNCFFRGGAPRIVCEEGRQKQCQPEWRERDEEAKIS